MDDKKTCTLTDAELIEKAYEWIHKLAKSKGDAWCLRIPVDFNHDPDMVFSELCIRLQSSDRIRAEARAEALKEAADRAVTWYRQGQLIPAHKDSFAIKQLRAAILADEPKEERGAKKKHEAKCVKCPTCLGYGGDCDAGPDGRSVSWYCRTCGGSGVIYPAEVERCIEEARP